MAWASPRAACAGSISISSTSTRRASPGVWPAGSSSTSRARAVVSMTGFSRGRFSPRPISQVSKASWLCSTRTEPRAKCRNARRASAKSGASTSIWRSIRWRRRAYGLMGARELTRVSKSESDWSRRNRSAPISRTRKGRLPVVSMSTATYSASVSGVSGLTPRGTSAGSFHSTGSAPRGLSLNTRPAFTTAQGNPTRRRLADSFSRPLDVVVSKSWRVGRVHPGRLSCSFSPPKRRAEVGGSWGEPAPPTL